MEPTHPVRRAGTGEASALAELNLSSRRAAPGVPPAVHDDAAVRSWLATQVLPAGGTWVTEQDGHPVGMLVLTGDWVDQLYVAPGAKRCGHGAALLTFAQSRRDELWLWTFVANHGARAFYAARGFAPVGAPDTANEERAPALRYHWRRASTNG